MNLDLLINEAMSVANVTLSYYFDTMMYERYRHNYTSEILQYCEQYGQDESISPTIRKQINHIKDKIEEKGIEIFDCRSHLDITAMNHLILYSTFRVICEEPFATPEKLEKLNSKPIVIPPECPTKFSFAVKTIVDSRNAFRHDNESLAKERDLLEELNNLKCVLALIDAVDKFLEPFNSMNWNKGIPGRKSYIENVNSLLNQLKEHVLNGEKKADNITMHFSGMNSTGSVRVRLRHQEDGSIIANWKLSKDDIEFRLSFGRYILEAYNEDDTKAHYNISPNNISVLGTGESLRSEFVIEREKSQKERMIDAFTHLAIKGKDNDSIGVIAVLDEENYEVATPFLSFLYKYGIWVDKNLSLALDYKTAADILFIDLEEAQSLAYEAKERGEYLFAAIMYINFSILSNDGAGYFNAAICLYKANVAYELCVRCLELAKELGYAPDNDSNRIDLLLQGLNSKQGKRKFGVIH